MTKKLIMLSVMAVLLLFSSVMIFGENAEAAKKKLLASGDCRGLYYDYYENEYVIRGKNVKYRLYEDGTLVIFGNGVMGNFDTTEVEMDVVYRRKELIPWYDYRKKIRKVVIKEGVTNIGSASFYGCKNLESVQWADSVEKIGNRAFYGCKKLKSIPWTENIKIVGYHAFQKCTSLEEVRLPSHIKIWWEDVFAECTGLKKVSFDTNFKFPLKYDEDYGKGMFKGCTSLEEVRLPRGLTVIPSRFVEGCTSLKVFPIPDNVTYWGSYPPSLCKGKYVLPDSVQTLAEGAFAGCSDLEELILPEGLVYMGRAFEGCNSLKTVKIPKSVRELDETFYNCTGLKSIVIPNTVQSGLEVNRWDFNGCGVFEGCSNLKSIVLPNNMKCIGFRLLKNCKSLKKINLPPKLKEIEYYAFSSCTSLEEIDIPKGVDELKDEVFYNCKSLKSVTVRTKKRINFGQQVFYGCKNLSSIVIYAKKNGMRDQNTFDEISEEVTIYVPEGSVKGYKKWLKETDIKKIKPIQ